MNSPDPGYIRTGLRNIAQTTRATMPRRRRPSPWGYLAFGLWWGFVAGCVAGQIAWRVFG